MASCRATMGPQRTMTTTASPVAQPLVLPDDEYNRRLVADAHPAAWANPVPAHSYNLVVLGAGTAGLVSAVGAASLGARVAIVERHLMGGDCLNFGCVPSKAVISAARTIDSARRAAAYGLSPAPDAAVDFGAVMTRMRRLRADLAGHDSVARLTALGIDVFLGAARFTGSRSVAVGGQTLRFSRAVIATGARPSVPDIPGLAEAGYLTNETVFSLTERPGHLLVIGAGPIGCELAQTFRRLGSAVTVIGREPTLLPNEDPDASALLAQRFSREDIATITGASVLSVHRPSPAAPVVVTCESGGHTRHVTGDALLVAVGRTPNLEGLGLDAAGIAADARGVIVTDTMRTTNRGVYAAGDVCSSYTFTHAADAMARIVLQNALFFGRKKASALLIPWATYTDPEVAHVGMTAREAAARGDRVVTLTAALSHIDRAVLEDETEGFARVHVDRRSGRILGATMVACHAGELIGEAVVAMKAGVTMSTLGFTIHPYPTQSEAWKRLGDDWNRRRLSPRVRAVLGTLMRWRR